MATIAWISAATVAGGVISIAIAALFALSAPASWVPALVSFAIGTLLGGCSGMRSVQMMIKKSSFAGSELSV